MNPSTSTTNPDLFEAKLRQRASAPMTTTPLEMPVEAPKNTHGGGNLPNTPLTVSIISFLLGSLFTIGFTTFLIGGSAQLWWATPQLGFFVASWAAFHWAEFAVTAGWNRERCNVDSFLLDNGVHYHVAHSVAVAEYLLTLYFAPSWKAQPYLTPLGMVLVVASQSLRSGAMIKASTNFSHAVAFRKVETHRLVSDGIYAWFRHPSYAGFFYWALGSQLVLQNPLSFVAFAIVLWRFFYHRIRGEERALIQFFGKQYEDYRARVGTKIPFIP